MKEKANRQLLGNESEGSAELESVSDEQERREDDGEPGAGQAGAGQSSTSGHDEECSVQGAEGRLSRESAGRARPGGSKGPWGHSPAVSHTSARILHVADTTCLLLHGISSCPRRLMSWLLSLSVSFSVRTRAVPVPPRQASSLMFSRLNFQTEHHPAAASTV